MPRFETKQDLIEERRIADLLEKKWGVTLTKRQDPAIDMDVTLDGMLLAFIEIKCRNNRSGRELDPIFLSVNHKWKSGRALTEEYGVPCHVVWEFNDGMWICNLANVNDETCERKRTGRTNRGGAGVNDIEECWLIPLSLMKEVKL